MYAKLNGADIRGADLTDALMTPEQKVNYASRGAIVD